MKRCAEGDLESALKEAMKSVSQQSRQIAEYLDSASREQTGASVNEHINRGQSAFQEAASIVRQQAQGISHYLFILFISFFQIEKTEMLGTANGTHMI